MARQRSRRMPPESTTTGASVVPESGRVSDLVVRAATGEGSTAGRTRLLGLIAARLAASAKAAGVRAVAGGRWLAEELLEVTPRIPVRDAAVLRAQHPGRSDAEIAETLIRHASRTTAGIGAAAGAVASAEYLAPATLLAAPVQLAAETLAVAAVEIKLVAELHELAGVTVRGSLSERASAYLMSWVRRRAIDPAVAGTGLAALLGHTAKRELRTRLMRRLGRNMTTLAPMLAGAAAGAEVNRRATRALGEKLLDDLRRGATAGAEQR